RRVFTFQASILSNFRALSTSISWQLTWGVTGVGGALVTSAYGLYIVREGRRVVRSYRALTPA
ncbi:hypothetical protein, partial [Microcella pacifica]|uniref:hypothetical protein n=1 Tax=Microcella pacifica TaxID=2591847 RepID=UPI001AEF40A0